MICMHVCLAVAQDNLVYSLLGIIFFTTRYEDARTSQEWSSADLMALMSIDQNDSSLGDVRSAEEFENAEIPEQKTLRAFFSNVRTHRGSNNEMFVAGERNAIALFSTRYDDMVAAIRHSDESALQEEWCNDGGCIVDSPRKFPYPSPFVYDPSHPKYSPFFNLHRESHLWAAEDWTQAIMKQRGVDLQSHAHIHAILIRSSNIQDSVADELWDNASADKIDCPTRFECVSTHKSNKHATHALHNLQIVSHLSMINASRSSGEVLNSNSTRFTKPHMKGGWFLRLERARALDMRGFPWMIVRG